jgi:hypothetical protein
LCVGNIYQLGENDMKTAQQVKIYHAAFETEASEVAVFTPVTAELEVRDALAVAYELTQNIAGSWSRGEFLEGKKNGDFDSRIEVIGGRGRDWGLRSTSAGDAAEVVVYNEKTESFDREYFVLTMVEGWERVLPFEFDMYLESKAQFKSMVRDGNAVRKMAMGEAA